MGGNGLVGRLRDMLDGLSGRNRINKFDFGILQTMMMVAASDGDFSDVERECISALAERVRKARADSVEGLVGNSMWTSPTSIR